MKGTSMSKIWSLTESKNRWKELGSRNILSKQYLIHTVCKSIKHVVNSFLPIMKMDLKLTEKIPYLDTTWQLQLQLLQTLFLQRLLHQLQPKRPRQQQQRKRHPKWSTAASRTTNAWRRTASKVNRRSCWPNASSAISSLTDSRNFSFTYS